MAFKTKQTTVWVILCVAALLIGWDLYVWKVPDATISEVVLSAARRHPVIPFLFGVLMGHLFWYQKEIS